MSSTEAGTPVKDVPSPGKCDSINAERDAQTASFLAAANQTCQTHQACLLSCNPNNLSAAPTIYIFEPTSWRCKQLTAAYELGDAHEFLVESDEGSLLDQAFEAAIKNTSKRYVFRP